MQHYWVYLWAYQYGAYRDSETFVFAASASDALLAAMRQHQVSFADEAFVVLHGPSYAGEAFHNVSFVRQEVY